MSKVFSGFTEKTMEKLQLDAGAWFKNYSISEDTFDEAVLANKLIGATQNGGAFEAKAEIRTIEVDGIKGDAKGMTVIDKWVVTLGANILEFDTATIKLALGAASVDTTTNEEYDIITAKNKIEDADYLDNVTWVGTISGSNKPVIIQIFNAINLEGMKLDVKDKNNGVLAMLFKAHYTQSDLDTPPFKIYYPKVA